MCDNGLSFVDSLLAVMAMGLTGLGLIKVPSPGYGDRLEASMG